MFLIRPRLFALGRTTTGKRTTGLVKFKNNTIMVTRKSKSSVCCAPLINQSLLLARDILGEGAGRVTV